MDRIKGLREYVKGAAFREALQIPGDAIKGGEARCEPLAQGEYNINYTFRHPVTGRKLLLRVNTGSQMHLENQIEYEYHALKLLRESGRTPEPFYVDGSRKYLDYGVMIMEFLEGKALNYRTDLGLAAECLADIHSVPIEGQPVREQEKDPETICGLIWPKNPLQAIIDECNEMAETYYHSKLGETEKKKQIERMLAAGQKMVEEIKDYDGYCCCINTELNSGNFLINGAWQPNYLIDWEKPLYGDPVQDLGHFLAPTTTFWKTDVILTGEEMGGFVKEYKKAVKNRFDVNGLEERLKLFIPITCLRGITWCAMAWVQYQEPGRLIRNEETFRKIEAYLEDGFLDRIENGI